jgi:hypothetical protein
MTTCQTSLLVPLLAKSQKLPVSQLARHVDLFHLVITDNQRPETLSLPHGLAPPIKSTTEPLLPDLEGDNPAVCNKSFFSTCGEVFIRQFLTSGAETRERLTRRSGPGCSLGLHVLPSPEPRLLN